MKNMPIFFVLLQTFSMNVFFVNFINIGEQYYRNKQ